MTDYQGKGTRRFLCVHTGTGLAGTQCGPAAVTGIGCCLSSVASGLADRPEQRNPEMAAAPLGAREWTERGSCRTLPAGLEMLFFLGACVTTHQVVLLLTLQNRDPVLGGFFPPPPPEQPLCLSPKFLPLQLVCIWVTSDLRNQP